MKNAIICLQIACDIVAFRPTYEYLYDVDPVPARCNHIMSCTTKFGTVTARADTKRQAKLLVAAKSMFRVIKSWT